MKEENIQLINRIRTLEEEYNAEVERLQSQLAAEKLSSRSAFSYIQSKEEDSQDIQKLENQIELLFEDIEEKKDLLIRKDERIEELEQT